MELFFCQRTNNNNTLDEGWTYQTSSKPKSKRDQESIEPRRETVFVDPSEFVVQKEEKQTVRNQTDLRLLSNTNTMGSCQSSEPAAAQKRSTKATSLDLTNVFREESAGPECAIDDSAKAADSTISCSQKSTTTREKMKLWKEELEASENLTKTVVHIEVSTVDIIGFCATTVFVSFSKEDGNK